jgi:hypothetical protein
MTQTIYGGDLKKPQNIGEAGNQTIFDGYFKAVAASTGTDTEVQLLTLPEGAKVNRFTATFSAQGVNGATHPAMTIGWKYKNGRTGGTATAFITSTDTYAASSVTANYLAEDLTALGSSGNPSGVFDGDVIVYATFSAVAIPVAFQLYVAAEGRYAGTR